MVELVSRSGEAPASNLFFIPSEMGSILERKYLLPIEANSFLLE